MFFISSAGVCPHTNPPFDIVRLGILFDVRFSVSQGTGPEKMSNVEPHFSNIASKSFTPA